VSAGVEGCEVGLELRQDELEDEGARAGATVCSGLIGAGGEWGCEVRTSQSLAQRAFSARFTGPGTSP
jgi:hypothetical protein